MLPLTPSVSIVIPVYNGETFLEACLDSIIAQTCPYWECIIVNDGSTDNTLSIIESYTNRDARFSFHSICNTGTPKVPRDLAISKAKTKWIMPIDADDFIDNAYIERMLLRAQETKAEIVFPRMHFVKSNCLQKPIHILPVKSFSMSQIISGKEAVMHTIFDVKIGTNGALISQTLFRFLSSFNKGTSFLREDDYDMRELIIHSRLVAFTETVYYYRQHPDAVTQKPNVRTFEYLIADAKNEALIRSHFGEQSVQVMQVQRFRMLGLISRQVLWLRYTNKFTTEQKKETKDLLRKSSKEIPIKFYFDPFVWKKVLYFGHLQFKQRAQSKQSI